MSHVGVSDYYYYYYYYFLSRWLRSQSFGSTAARLLGLRDRISPRARISVSSECFVLSGRSFCDEPIPRSESSYRERERERESVCVSLSSSATIISSPTASTWRAVKTKKEGVVVIIIVVVVVHFA